MYEEWKNKSIVAVSNADFSEQIESESSKFDIVIRFNKGSNQIILSEYSYYNNKTDLCVLSGWKNGDFGDYCGFLNKKILFSRPKDQPNLKYGYNHISVKKYIEDKVKEYASHIDYIPLDIFYNIYDKYKYNCPTTGFVLVYYIKNILNLNISTINFFKQNNYNYFIQKYPSKNTSHKINLEKSIFSELNIKNTII